MVELEAAEGPRPFFSFCATIVGIASGTASQTLDLKGCEIEKIDIVVQEISSTRTLLGSTPTQNPFTFCPPTIAQMYVRTHTQPPTPPSIHFVPSLSLSVLFLKISFSLSLGL